MSQSQLYEWIKASEKLPKKQGWYFIKNTVSEGHIWFDGKKFINNKIEVIGANVEWLSPVSTDEKLGADDMMTLAVDEPIILTRLDVPIIRDDRESGSRQHSPDGASVVSLPCTVGNNIEHYKKFKDILSMIITLQAVVVLTEHKVGLNTVKELRWHIEREIYPIGGYAPGNYSCKCASCSKTFIGDKRAVQCEDCAIALLTSTDSNSKK